MLSLKQNNELFHKSYYHMYVETYMQLEVTSPTLLLHFIEIVILKLYFSTKTLKKYIKYMPN